MPPTCLEGPTVLAPAALPVSTVAPPVITPVAVAPAPAFQPTTSGIFSASALSVQYGSDTDITIGDDVTVSPECSVEFEIGSSWADQTATTTTCFDAGYTQPWLRLPMYGTSAVIKKMTIKGYSSKKWGHWGKFSVCSADTQTSWGTLVFGQNTTAAYWGIGDCYQKSKEEIFREKLKANLRPEIVTKNQQLWGLELTEEELRARTLLYELIGDVDFRRYLRRGFIMVTGKSGTLYKISGGHNRIVSYKKANTGRLMPFEEFCVVFTQYNLPFTDGVIMRKLLVEHDEFSLRKKSNVFQVGEKGKFTVAPPAILRAG